MSTREKLTERFMQQPKDFTFAELTRLLGYLGFDISNKGKTSGSRVRFFNKENQMFIDLHKPHTQGGTIKETALKDIYNRLSSNNLIK